MNSPDLTHELEDDQYSSEEYMRNYDDSPRCDENDQFDAPVLWIKRTFNSSKESITKALLTSFEEANRLDVEILELYTTIGRAHV